ncbi:hypothetical protein B9Z19DRAFT_1095780 [Tuber borchii]|uniref:Uncharacterized protein n=1 Tax=Tuber borchii TaxID=42251 RepID=A0A2T6ZCF2_TUBBO|nr:hypothetical protein B9Z19DRAFT_1095780 [Tuber borchii]
MATKYSTVANEPIEDILDRTHNGQIAALSTDFCSGSQSAIPVVEHLVVDRSLPWITLRGLTD